MNRTGQGSLLISLKLLQGWSQPEAFISMETTKSSRDKRDMKSEQRKNLLYFKQD